MRFLLVHSPLIGPQSWAGVAEVLIRLGHEVVVPDLHGDDADGPGWETHAAIAVESATISFKGAPLVAVAHSGAGPLLPSIGSDLRDVEAYVFVDAALPHPGRSRLESLPTDFASHLRSLAQGGWLPPWHEWFDAEAVAQLVPDTELRLALFTEAPALPLSLFEENLPEAVGWPDAPCAYLRLSEAYVEEERDAAELGWTTASIDGNHLSIASTPDVVAEALESLASQASQSE